MFAKAQPALSEESCVRESFVSGVHGKTCGCVRTVVLEESPVGYVQVSLSGLCSRESSTGCIRQKPYWLSLKKCLKRALAVFSGFCPGAFRVIGYFSGYRVFFWLFLCGTLLSNKGESCFLFFDNEGLSFRRRKTIFC